MKKISTLYKKDSGDLGRVINEVNPENQWVFDGEGFPSRKYDGTAVAIVNGELYKRYDVKPGRKVPNNSIPCQEPDEITGHWPHWVKCDRNKKEDKYFFEAFEKQKEWKDGTYELCGPKVQNNKEKFSDHVLVRHGIEVLEDCIDFSFKGLRQYLSNPDLDIEGIVFHHNSDGRMCKIRKKDFGIKR